MMASKVKDLINCGANIIGGCCGTTPAHIQALVKEIRKY
jgi:methionine synthase I (cobalamin-dependent)